jgi:hypothetical protein
MDQRSPGALADHSSGVVGHAHEVVAEAGVLALFVLCVVLGLRALRRVTSHQVV